MARASLLLVALFAVTVMMSLTVEGNPIPNPNPNPDPAPILPPIPIGVRVTKAIIRATPKIVKSIRRKSKPSSRRRVPGRRG
ncbi:UNVERIFIED_CONTAM: hypothetical protein RMT77_015934 [Armadillidium vulgare]